MKSLALFTSVTLLLSGCVADRPRPNVYDDASIFGGEVSLDALPDARPGEIVLRYSGHSLRDMEEAGLLIPVQPEIARQKYYDGQGPAGVYHILFTPPYPSEEELLGIGDTHGEYFVRADTGLTATLLAVLLLHFYSENGNTISDKSNSPLLQIMDALSCVPRYPGIPEPMRIGLYFGDANPVNGARLYIDEQFCYVLGGGVWEGQTGT